MYIANIYSRIMTIIHSDLTLHLHFLHRITLVIRLIQHLVNKHSAACPRPLIKRGKQSGPDIASRGRIFTCAMGGCTVYSIRQAIKEDKSVDWCGIGPGLSEVLAFSTYSTSPFCVNKHFDLEFCDIGPFSLCSLE